MASLGEIVCTRVSGTLPAQRERSEVWQVPGIDGYGLALLGKGESETQLRAVLYSSNAGLNVWYASIQLLQGTIGEITVDTGESYATCFFKKIGALTKTAAVIPGSAVTMRGEIEVEAILL